MHPSSLIANDYVIVSNLWSLATSWSCLVFVSLSLPPQDRIGEDNAVGICTFLTGIYIDVGTPLGLDSAIGKNKNLNIYI